ncbi:MmpS family transport accessory protein [Gordonia caeni]|uniref:MmpS family membrane protein n=1 Tax=Gordonia caeni TaxID=1007097 RepID=A0ABP7PM80_9ACTN
MTMPPPGPQQPYPAGPPPQYQAPKKKKVWPWILGGVILIFILFIGGCMALFGGVANEIDKESKRTVEVTYRVTGDGGPVSVTYSDANFNISQDTEVPLPWEKEVTIDGLGKTASLTATNNFQAATGSTVTCEILVDGAVKYTNTASGPAASASCSGDVG